MDEKELYKDFNNINIDEHEFDNIDVCMTDIQRKRFKSNLKKRAKNRKFFKLKIGAAGTAAALACIIGISYANPSFASQIPLLNPIVEMLGFTGDYADYSAIINKTVTYGGESFTINNVVCYDNNIIIGYSAKSNKKIDSRGPLFFPTFKVDGKWLNVGSTGGVKNIDDKNIMGTIELISDEMKLPDNFKLDMSFKKFDGISGNWDFKFNISKSQLSKNAKVYKPNKVVTCNNNDFTIAKIYLTPLNTSISMHSSKKIDYSAENHENQFPSLIVLDDKGNELWEGSSNAKSSDDGSNYTSSYSKISIDTKYLTFIPYVSHGGGYSYTGKNGKEVTVEIPDPYAAKDKLIPINTKLPIEVSQGNNGKVILNKIAVSDDKATIQGIIEGKLPEHQTVHLEGDNPKADIKLLKTDIKKIAADKYEFTEEYSGLNKDKNFKIRIPNLDYILYDARVIVPLK